ncbi:MAG: 16S rRNA (uracil(1498)-N(3))-methyltransferase [Woeseia sp.]|nr:16S rRNA (uracil(1498)-N(3))-methyltransferase [Woeseia sp.]
MSIPRLFVDQALAANSEVTLRGDAARYIGRVLRARPGDLLTLFDGRGEEFSTRIQQIDKNCIELRLGEGSRRDTESPLAVRLLQGISRGDRMDFVVQKSTELGVHRITPLQTEFSVVRLNAQRAAKRLQHWQGICASACEQCGRNVLPVIDGALTLSDFLSLKCPTETTRLMLSPEATETMESLKKPTGSVELLIGPEGGFSEQESTLARQHGFLPIAIGPRVLRTETAAVAAVALVQAFWGDLGGVPRPGS